MKKKQIKQIFVAFLAFIMSGTVCFAEPALNESTLTTDASNVGDEEYRNQAKKSVLAFFSNNPDDALPLTFDDVVILDEGVNIQESYIVEIPENNKDYIVILFGGSDGLNARTIITLPHTTHRPSADWSADAEYHWKECENSECTYTEQRSVHIPDVSSDCTEGNRCSVCDKVLTEGAAEHTFTDSFDASCNTENCTFERTGTSVTVTCNAAGGTVSTPTVTTAADGKLISDLPTPVRNGYSFLGWHTAAQNGIKIDNTSTVFYDDATVYAHWNKLYQGGSSTGGSSGGGFVGVTSHTLNFNTNGGSEVNSIVRTKNITINLESFITAKENYEFAGWCDDAALTNVVTEVKLTNDMIVYAKWNEKNEADSDIQNNQSDETEAIFSDVSSDSWFSEAVSYVADNGIMNGVSETEFAPHNTTTRAMLVTMLYRLEGEPETLAQNEFLDVSKDSYYEKAVIWSKENGIVNGYENGSFGADDEVTREQLASILYRYAEYKGYDTNYEAANTLSFNDVSEISEYAYPALAWACENGIINGDGNNLMPKASAERCQVAAIFQRFIG